MSAPALEPRPPTPTRTSPSCSKQMDLDASFPPAGSLGFDELIGSRRRPATALLLALQRGVHAGRAEPHRWQNTVRAVARTPRRATVLWTGPFRLVDRVWSSSAPCMDQRRRRGRTLQDPVDALLRRRWPTARATVGEQGGDVSICSAVPFVVDAAADGLHHRVGPEAFPAQPDPNRWS